MAAVIQKILLKIGCRSLGKSEYCMLSFCETTCIDVSVIVSGGLTVTQSHNMTLNYTNTVINVEQ